MYEALNQALATASAEDGIGVVMFAGAGGVFSAGNDINDFAMRAMAAARWPSPGATFIRALARFEKPIVAAVDGLAVGIGTTLCFHCDLVYASPNALFKMPFVDLGIVPEAGSSYLAPRRFGYARAAEYLLLAESFGPETAREIGFVNAVVPAEFLYSFALEKARALAAKPRAALLGDAPSDARRRRGAPGAYGKRARSFRRRATLQRSARRIHGVLVEAEGIAPLM